MKKAASDTERERVLTEATLGAAESLGLKGEALASVLGISPSSVSRMHNGDFQLNPDAKAWELGVLLVRLYRGLDAIMAGDEEALRAWMNNPNRDLHANPAELIRKVEGLVDTLAYVDAHRARV